MIEGADKLQKKLEEMAKVNMLVVRPELEHLSQNQHPHQFLQ